MIDDFPLFKTRTEMLVDVWTVSLTIIAIYIYLLSLSTLISP